MTDKPTLSGSDRDNVITALGVHPVRFHPPRTRTVDPERIKGELTDDWTEDHLALDPRSE